jgi:hypothetical protein
MLKLGLPEEKEHAGVYIARPWPGIGVCVKYMISHASKDNRYLITVGVVPESRSPASLLLDTPSDNHYLTAFAEVREDSALMVLAVIQEILKTPPICRIGQFWHYHNPTR